MLFIEDWCTQFRLKSILTDESIRMMQKHIKYRKCKKGGQNKCCQLQLMTAMIKVLLSNLGSCAKYFHIFDPIKSFRLKLFDILTLKL